VNIVGLLEDCRNFLSNYTKNVVLIGVLSYIIIKYINSVDKKEGFEESFSENIKIIQKDKSGEIIWDSVTGYYSLLINGTYVKSAKTLSTLKSNKEGINMNVKEEFISDEIKKYVKSQYNKNDFDEDKTVKDLEISHRISNKDAATIVHKLIHESFKNNWKERLNKIYKESFKEDLYHDDLDRLAQKRFHKKYNDLSHFEQKDIDDDLDIDMKSNQRYKNKNK
jgi:hypothetical protein